jgi:hypothetical protein
MILFVNFVWAEIEIIPVFFVTLSWYLIRFRTVDMKNIFLSVISLLISIFFFLYPLVLIPTFIIYTKGKTNKLFMFIAIFLVGGLFLLLDVHMFTGYFYNYISSLSGTNPTLAPSSLPTGFFYYFHITGESRISTEIALIIIASFFLPLVLRGYNLTEVRVLYIILALFIFISPVINMDNFMFLLPFIFLVILDNSNKTISKKVLYSSLALTLVPVIFAQIVYSNNGVFGFFYWFYPLLHSNGISISGQQINSVIIPSYNFFFLLLVFFSVISLIERNMSNQTSKYLILDHYTGKKLTPVSRKKKILALIGFVIIMCAAIPMAVVYNNNNNDTSLIHPAQFPLLYFYPEKVVNSSIYLPIGKNSYSMAGPSLHIPNSDASLFLYRKMLNQSSHINLDMTINNSTGNGPIAYTNTWSIQKRAFYNKTLIHPYGLVNIQNANKTIEKIPFLNENITTYFLNGNGTVSYGLNSSEIQNNNFLLFFKLTRISEVQSLPFYMKIGNNVLELAQYPSFEVIATYSQGNGWTQSPPIYYEMNAHQWQVISLNYENNTISLTVNGVTYGISFPKSFSNLSISTGNPFDNINYSFAGYTSILFSYSRSVNPIHEKIVFIDGNTESIISKVRETNQLTVNIQNVLGNSSVKVNCDRFKVGYSKFLYLQKTGGGNEFIAINKLVIINNGSGYYLVPAFLLCYFSFTFTIFAAYYTVILGKKR